MSDYGITTGWYKYPHRADNNGRLVNVYKTTKQFVAVKIYKYFDNKYDLTNMNEEHLIIQDLKTKVYIFPGKIEWPFIKPKQDKCRYNLQNREDEQDVEQPPSPDDGTAEYDIDELFTKEKEPKVEKIFAKKKYINIKEIVLKKKKETEFLKMTAKNAILKLIFNDDTIVRDKYYLEITQAIINL